MSVVPTLGTDGPDRLNTCRPGDALFEPSILYEDGDLFAVDKPAGIVIHPTYKHPDGTLFDALAAWEAAHGRARPCLLHRLDRDTTGVVLLARTEQGRRGLVRQFEQRRVRKWYLALTHGVPAPATGEIALPLARDATDRRLVVADPAGKVALTQYHVIATADDLALVLVEPKTGRTHQIRAHFTALGHPLVGDAAYEALAARGAAARASPDTLTSLGAEPRRSPTHSAAARQMLHAAALAARHPRSSAPLYIRAPIPADFAALIPPAWLALAERALADCALADCALAESALVEAGGDA